MEIFITQCTSIYSPDINHDMVEIGKFFDAVIPYPQSKYWKWATLSLTYEANTILTTEGLHGLEELVEMASKQQIPHFPPNLFSKDYQPELEAVLWWNLGKAYSEKKNEMEAIKWYKKAANRLGKDPKLSISISHTAHNIGHTLMEEERYQEAISFFSQAIDFSPFASYLYADRGSCFVYNEDYQLAIKDFNQSIRLEPTFTRSYFLRGRAYIALGEYQQALADFDRIIQLDPKDADAYLEKGTIYSKHLKNLQRGIEDFNRAIDLNPTLAAAYNNRGQAYERNNDYKRAIDDYNHAINLEPENPFYYNNRGNCFTKLEKSLEAIDDYTRVITLEEASDQTDYENLSYAYLQIREYQKALENINHAIDINNDKSALYIQRAKIYFSLNSFQEAADDYDLAIQIDKQFEHTGLKEKALIFLKLKKYYEAQENFIKALKSKDGARCSECWQNLADICGTPHFSYKLKEDILSIPLLATEWVAVLIPRSNVLKAIGQYQRALADLDHACQLDKDSRKRYYNAEGLLNSYLGKYSEAMSFYNLALKTNEDQLAARYNIAVSLTRWKGLTASQKEVEEARTALLDLLSTNENEFRALYGLGGLEALERKNDNALDYLEKALIQNERVWEWARHDIAWEDLQKNRRFQSLMNLS